MTETTGKSAAAALAKELLRERIALVTTLGAQIDAHKVKVAAVADARAAEHETAEAARAAHAAAIAGGWTAKDLKNAGLVVPAAPRGRPTGTKTAPKDTSETALVEEPSGV